MSAPGSSNELGFSEVTDFSRYSLKVPTTQAPPEDGSPAAAYGSKTDMGALVLSLVSNWFINGETVLIDGGVRVLRAEHTCLLTRLAYRRFWCIRHRIERPRGGSGRRLGGSMRVTSYPFGTAPVIPRAPHPRAMCGRQMAVVFVYRVLRPRRACPEIAVGLQYTHLLYLYTSATVETHINKAA